MMTKGVNEYRKVGAHGGVAASDPHRLILLLMNGALDAIAVAKGHMRRGEIAEKGVNISRAISIVDGLRASLDHGVGGELVRNLDELYEYIAKRLLQANIQNEAGWLDEVSQLMREIRGAWESIPEDDRKVSHPNAPAPSSGLEVSAARE